VVSLAIPIRPEPFTQKRWRVGLQGLTERCTGALIDENSLLAELEDGQLSVACLDVVCDEPLSLANPRLRLPQVLLAPHIVAFTDLMLGGTVDFICQVVSELESGRKPESTLNAPLDPRHQLRADGVSTSIGLATHRLQDSGRRG
jgi:hypothetical protein